MNRKATALVLSIFSVGLLVLWFHYSDFSTTTSYCPWGHRIGFGPWVCRFQDTKGSRVLVEHANLDINKLELSIEDHGVRHWIQHPNGRVRDFSPALDQNTIKFDPVDPNLLIVNGERFQVTDVSKP